MFILYVKLHMDGVPFTYYFVYLKNQEFSTRVGTIVDR